MLRRCDYTLLSGNVESDVISDKIMLIRGLELSNRYVYPVKEVIGPFTSIRRIYFLQCSLNAVINLI